ncbi:hypothetical protein BBAD15_g11646 [Beauveria bassiana D1-5]|uniref:EVE domain-containing protein n=1 Tax=Beauveria bassiana D1-5 TaxID=1245745 RepID=A0A0A2VQQ1_BEABA|nr:hypothetical protein BBAD15_g11646 [Beauveria bassiana D1-5]
MGSHATTTAATGAGIALVPWDPASDSHADRMTTQRHACGWDVDKVSHWRERVTAGDKLLFWVVLSSGDGNDAAEALLAKHTSECAAEKGLLRDTAARVGRTARKATGDAFIPIGHIALDEYPARNVLFGLPPATLWIKSFYISKEIMANDGKTTGEQGNSVGWSGAESDGAGRGHGRRAAVLQRGAGARHDEFGVAAARGEPETLRNGRAAGGGAAGSDQSGVVRAAGLQGHGAAGEGGGVREDGGEEVAGILCGDGPGDGIIC